MPTSVMRKRKQNPVEFLINNLLDKILGFRTLCQVLFVCFLVEKHPRAQEQSKHPIFTTWCTGRADTKAIMHRMAGNWIPSTLRTRQIISHLFIWKQKWLFKRSRKQKRNTKVTVFTLLDKRVYIQAQVIFSIYSNSSGTMGIVKKTCFNGKRFF